ncbi:MAG: isoprenylcysteine carboxylmethyltransferase family protein [Hyphomonadaceae bacterium]|nr:isoprenylcysteine carboxylmethyltransferase family protein [Hyphomonadaceae bacterium]
MSERKDHPGVIAPPPLVFVGFLALGLAVDHFVSGPSFGLPLAFRAGGAAILGALALWIVGAAIGLFHAAGTSARPWKESTAIVTTGIYGLTRNPMYLSMAMLFAGVALALDSLIALMFLAPALLVIEFGVIRREERYLEAKFGDEYRRYKAQVRRWF